MATKDELEDQLSIAKNINAVVEKMAATLSRMETSFSAQNDYLSKMQKTLSNFNLSGASNEVSNLTNEIKNLSGKINDASNTSNDFANKFAQNARRSTASSAEMNNSFKDVYKNLIGISKAKTFKGMLHEIVTSSKKLTTLSQLFKKYSEKVRKHSVVLAALAGAAHGAFDALSNLYNLGKSFSSLLVTMGKGAVNLGLSIASIPLQIFQGIVDLAASANAGFYEWLQAIEDVRKAFGDLEGPSSKTIKRIHTDLRGFSDTGLSAWRVFGDYAERLKYVNEITQALGATLDVTHEEWRQNGGALLAYQKGLGLSAEQLKVVAQRAISTGKTVSQELLDMTKQTTELSDAFGISQKVIGKDMAKAMQDMRHFATLSIKEIAKASVYARKLGVELDKITGTLDAFETFDSAAENASKLTQAFGVQVDAFKLMEAQDPAEQIDMLRKSFARAGVDVNNFNRQQLKLLTSTTNLDEQTAKQVFSLKNQGLSLDQIKKKSESAEKKQLTQAEAMQKLADSIERIIKPIEQVGSYFDQFFRGISRGLQHSEEFRRLIYNIKHGLHEVFMVGINLGRQLPQIIPGLHDLLKSMGDFFEPKRFRELAETASKAIKDYFTGKKSLSEIFESIQDKFHEFLSGSSPFAKQFIKGFKKIMMTLGKVITDVIPIIAKKLASGLRFLAEFIRDPKKALKGAGGQMGQFGFLTDILLNIASSLKSAWKIIKPALFDMLDALWDSLKEYWDTSPKLREGIRNGILLAFTYVTGMAAIQGAAAALGATLVGWIGSAISGLLSKTVATSVASAASTGIAAAAKSGGVLASLKAFGGKLASGAAAAAKAVGVGGAALGAGLAVTAYYSHKDMKRIDQSIKDGNEVHGKLASFQASSRLSAEQLIKKEQDLKSLISNAKEIYKKDEEGLFGTVANWAGYHGLRDANADLLAKAEAQLRDIQGRVKEIKTQEKQLAAETSSKPGVISLEPIKIVGSVKPEMTRVEISEAKKALKDVEELSAKLSSKIYKKQLSTIAKNFTTFQNDVEKIKMNGLASSVMAINEMIEQVNALNEAMSSLSNSVDIKTDLKHVAASLGLGSKGTYEIKHKPVNITVNLQVSINAEDMEKAIIMRDKSIIRNRLNFATSNPNTRGDNEILDKFGDQKEIQPSSGE